MMRLFKYTVLCVLALALSSGVAFGQLKSKEKNAPTGTAKTFNTASSQVNSLLKGPAIKTPSVNPTVNYDISTGLKSSKSTISVLILNAEGSGSALASAMAAYTDLSFTVFDTTNLATLSLADLAPFDVVFAYNAYQWEYAGGNRTLVGDVLAAYLDAGGKIVENEFLKSFDAWGLAGTYITGNYSAFGATTADDFTDQALGTVLLPAHPIMTGVSTLLNTYDNQDPTLAAGAVHIANWASGTIAIAAKPNVVSINMLPYDPEAAVLGFSGDGLILYHNAIVWLAGPATEGPDVSPTSLLNPLSSNLLTASESIIVKVANNDTAAVSDIPVSYSIDGGTIVNDTIHSTIAGGANYDFTFLTPYDFSIPGHEYEVMIVTSLAADTNFINDTLRVSVINYYDAASLSIDMAPVVAPGSIIPLATVKNNSSLAFTFNATMEIQGGYTSTKAVTSLAPGASVQVTFDAWTAAIGNYTTKVYTSLAQDADLTNDTLNGNIQVMDLVKAYVYVAYEGTSTLPVGPAYTYLQTPANVVSLADQSSEQFIGAGTWAYGNVWLGAVYSDNTLVSLDTLTGARTVLGVIGKSISGMAYDYSSNKLYGIDWDGTNANLYTINAFNGTPTLVGTCGTNLLINLACDLTGNLYSISTTNDSLYSINKSTGAITAIGPIGFDAAYAQDMEFDQNTGLLYLAAYNSVTKGEMRIMNPLTGATALLGGFVGGAEISGFAIPYVTVLPAIDGVMNSINGLNSGCELSSTETIEVTIKNLGTTAIDSCGVTFVVDGGSLHTESVTTTIPAGTSLNYTFTATANLATAGAHTIVAYISLPGDLMAWNDTATVTVNQIAPSTVPYAMGFEPTDNLTSWNIYDVNEDGYTWNVLATDGNTAPGCVSYSYNAASAANDWVVSTCIQLDAGNTYELAYYFMAISANFPESMMVHMGTGNTPADLTTMLADYPSIVNTTYERNLVNFTVPSNGVYYFGWHCNSAADMYDLFLDDISITNVTGVKETIADNSISISPNPVNGTLNIASGSELSNIRITNMVGSVIYDNDVTGKQFRINTESFGQGLYFITLKSEAGISTRKFIVE